MLLIAKHSSLQFTPVAEEEFFTSANQLLVGELRGIQAAKVSGQGHGCIRGDRQSLCWEALHPWIQPTVD